MNHMTVAAQVKQTLASLKGVRATLDSFTSLEKADETRKLLITSSQKLDDIIRKMEQRVAELEFQEPQYKGL